MVLVDTSVWIRFLSNRLDASNHLTDLLVKGEVAGHEYVFGELLVGDPGGRLPLLRDYRLMAQTETLGHEEVVNFVRTRRLHGRGIGWIDVHLLASALVGNSPLWSEDPRLSALALELNIAYQPPG